jgi:hypothetical protein
MVVCSCKSVCDRGVKSHIIHVYESFGMLDLVDTLRLYNVDETRSLISTYAIV